MQAIDAGQSVIYRAYETTPDDRFVREFILKLKLGSVRASYYIEKFGEDPIKRFAPQLAYMQQEGFGSVKGDVIELTREGLLQVDKLLHEFFLPQHRQYARYT